MLPFKLGMKSFCLTNMYTSDLNYLDQVLKNCFTLLMLLIFIGFVGDV